MLTATTPQSGRYRVVHRLTVDGLSLPTGTRCMRRQRGGMAPRHTWLTPNRLRRLNLLVADHPLLPPPQPQPDPEAAHPQTETHLTAEAYLKERLEQYQAWYDKKAV